MDRDCDLSEVRSALRGIARDMDYVVKEIEGWSDALPGPEMRAEVVRVCTEIANSVRFDILPELGTLGAKLATPPGLWLETANPDPAVNARMVTGWARSDVTDFVALVERVRAASGGSRDIGWVLCVVLLEETAVNLARWLSDIESELGPLAARADAGRGGPANGAA
jgi:hypothetical protein